MGLFSILDMNTAGMEVQQARLAVTASNMANARTTRAADGQVYQPLQVVVTSRPGEVPDGVVMESGGAVSLPVPVISTVTASEASPQLVFDPGHPDADERGFVRLPGVDPIVSMMELVAISRSYEANLRAFDVTRTLLQRTLEMWRGR
jgi:flagellar basal-body rod protein FlgC